MDSSRSKMIPAVIEKAYLKISTKNNEVTKNSEELLTRKDTSDTDINNANAGESSFVYLGGKIPIDASTLPNANLPIDPNMPGILEDESECIFSNHGIFNGANNDENVDIELSQRSSKPVELACFLAQGRTQEYNTKPYNMKAGVKAECQEESAVLNNKSFGYFLICQREGDYEKAIGTKLALKGLHQAPKLGMRTLSFFFSDGKWFQESQDKYVADIIKKFDFWSIGTDSTPIESNKPLVKDEDGKDVDVHVYRSMIGSLMYLTASRPDIMFAVCACLWYPRDSPFELEAFSYSDYEGASYDRKSTTGGCQFLGKRLISWQCKKQTIMANSTTEAEYVAAANYCGQVLWIQNQMMDYGFNFMNTRIHIDNESTISVIKNPVAHSRTKHIEIRFHFIRDCYEKRLIEVIKIHTDSNVANLLTKDLMS
ncbi:hypothetical protein Tco_1238788 [Tanacetum coccineum]